MWLPIVKGRYECKISTRFGNVKEGIKEIKTGIKKSRRIRINSIPMGLLDELKPLLAEKDVKIILPLGEKKPKDLEKLGEVATTKAKIYVEYSGKEANTGSVYLPGIIYSIVWRDGKILEISAMEYSKCVKCLRDTFEMAWRYSEK
jgi:hypothetical protein